MRADKFFLLDARRAGEFIGVDRMTAWRRLMVLCSSGVLQLVKQGNERQSNRYRYIAEQGEHGQ
jgi:hypothetical protein